MAKGACLKNCLITNNIDFGIKQSDLYSLNWRPKLSVEHCTIANNGGIGMRIPNIDIKNTIVYGNNDSGLQIETSTMGDFWEPVLNYCNVEGSWSGSGIGNIDVNPNFADTANRDYHLLSQAGRWDDFTESWIQDAADSPCIDAGDPADCSGNEPTGSGGRVNMGAYGGTMQASKTAVCIDGLDGQGKMPGDINHDCEVNLLDFVWIAADWLNSTAE